MTMTPHINPQSPDFPGDTTPEPPFGLWDSVRSLGIWGIGIPHLAAWAAFTVLVSQVVDTKRVDGAIKLMCKMVPRLAGVKINVCGRELVDPQKSYVYVVNHVNIFDMFAIYQAIPQYTRALEHIDHFSWPLFGPFITAAGQIPVDPNNPRLTAKGLRTARAMLNRGDSLVVLPEGSRTLDGSVGHFYDGAFRLAIGARVPVVPMAIHGGRAVSRREDWRIRPGCMKVRFGHPIETATLKLADVRQLATESRARIIAMLQQENQAAKAGG